MARYVVAFEVWVREEKLGMIASHYAGFAKGQTGVLSLDLRSRSLTVRLRIGMPRL